MSNQHWWTINLYTYG